MPPFYFKITNITTWHSGESYHIEFEVINEEGDCLPQNKFVVQVDSETRDKYKIGDLFGLARFKLVTEEL